MTFKELHLIAPLLDALETEGYTQPTPIQEQSIPIVLQKKDLLGCAQTGTGKTAAFALPILQLMSEPPIDNGHKVIKTLILTPTLTLTLTLTPALTTTRTLTLTMISEAWKCRK